RRFFLPEHSGNRVPQQLDHYEGPTSQGSRLLVRVALHRLQFRAHRSCGCEYRRGCGGCAWWRTSSKTRWLRLPSLATVVGVNIRFEEIVGARADNR
ncbi:hypothetical protein, partial [Mycolicibacterium porcinum]